MSHYFIVGKSFGPLEESITANGDSYTVLADKNAYDTGNEGCSIDFSSKDAILAGLKDIPKKPDGILTVYENYVLAIHEPQVDSFDDLKILLPWPTGELVATDRIEEICGEHATIADEMDALKKRQDEIKTEIGRFIQEFIDGRFVADADKIEIYGKSARKICMYSKTKTGTMLRITKNKQEEF